jgi:hypothetical protein
MGQALANETTQQTHRVLHLGDMSDPKFDTIEEMTEEQYQAFVSLNQWPSPATLEAWAWEIPLSKES